MVTTDHNKNIQRIIDVIKADTNVFDSGATTGKLREVNFGDPNNNDKLSINQKPAVYITTRNSIQSTKYSIGTNSATSPNQKTVEYEIVLLAVSKADTQRSQKQLYALMTNLETLFAGNPTFLKPVTNDDPIFSRSIINQIPWDNATKGQLITSVTYVLTATIGIGFSIDFPTIGNVPLLSKPNAPEGVIFDEDRLQADPNRVLTPNGDFGALFVEYQSTPTLDAAFRLKFGLEETITINTGVTARVVKVMYIEINPTAQFDEIERTILHMEIVKV